MDVRIRCIPDATSELARFKLDATYTVSVDADYTVSSLAAREQGSPTLSFPFSSFVPRKIFSATNLSVDPTVGRTVSLDLVNGDVRVSGSTNVGSSTADGQANLFVNSLLTTAAANVGLGANTTANVTVGHVSRWTGSGPLVLGGLGDAHLELQSDLHRSCAIICGPYTAARATATHAGVTMADGIGSNATASIRGVWSTGDLVVGNRGTAVVDLLATLVTPPFGVSIASAAEVTSNIVTVGVEPGSSGTVRVDGSFVTGFPNFVTSSSTWNVLGSLVLGGNGSVAGGTGRLSIGSSNTVTVNELFLMWQGGTLTLSGGGQLNVSGSAVLDGVLEFSATNLQAGNVFQVVSASGGVTGRFDQLNLPALNPGLSWDIDYNATNVTLTVVSNSVPGDYNNNGVADAADYTVWRDNRGGSVTLPNDTTPGHRHGGRL
ncbi:MAG: hypothetical protein O3C60_11425 [Planctomycetota bacterium]|nr:hypothetical protein [Planctomycetota bacterium]